AARARGGGRVGPPGVDPPQAGQDEVADVEVDGDALLLGKRRLLEVERALVPLEDAVDDLLDLELHALPEVLGAQGAQLDERLALPLPLGDRLDGGVVLLDRDLSLPDEDLAEPVVGEVAGGEDDAARA